MPEKYEKKEITIKKGARDFSGERFFVVFYFNFLFFWVLSNMHHECYCIGSRKMYVLKENNYEKNFRFWKICHQLFQIVRFDSLFLLKFHIFAGASLIFGLSLSSVHPFSYLKKKFCIHHYCLSMVHLRKTLEKLKTLRVSERSNDFP